MLSCGDLATAPGTSTMRRSFHSSWRPVAGLLTAVLLTAGSAGPTAARELPDRKGQKLSYRADIDLGMMLANLNTRSAITLDRMPIQPNVNDSHRMGFRGRWAKRRGQRT